MTTANAMIEKRNQSRAALTSRILSDVKIKFAAGTSCHENHDGISIAVGAYSSDDSEQIVYRGNLRTTLSICDEIQGVPISVDVDGKTEQLKTGELGVICFEVKSSAKEITLTFPKQPSKNPIFEHDFATDAEVTISDDSWSGEELLNGGFRVSDEVKLAALTGDFTITDDGLDVEADAESLYVTISEASFEKRSSKNPQVVKNGVGGHGVIGIAWTVDKERMYALVPIKKTSGTFSGSIKLDSLKGSFDDVRTGAFNVKEPGIKFIASKLEIDEIGDMLGRYKSPQWIQFIERLAEGWSIQQTTDILKKLEEESNA